MVTRSAAAKKSLATGATSKKSASARRSTAAKPAPMASKRTRSTSTAVTQSGRNALMVRMYRVGFGDFFLMTVPTASQPRYILIDCGVHAGNLKSMSACVEDLEKVTGGKLALVVVTHKHADHLSGFASEAEAFKRFEVEAVWITNRLNPHDPDQSRRDRQISALATQVKLQLQLAARDDERAVQAMKMTENALGAAGSTNDKALQVVTSGFANRPHVSYCEAGDEPELPPSLEGVLEARILGPAPSKLAARFSASDNRTSQYLAAAERHGIPDTRSFDPFDRRWPARASDYVDAAFAPWKPQEMEKVLHAIQPDALAAAAATIDGTLNNQSLVILFKCQKKNLLFVGDAQWGNWSYWLYGEPIAGQAPKITDDARKILASIDFYKVGHHGSTNATPIPVVSALRPHCVGMCSTQEDCYGNPEKKTEVPRTALMDALEKQSGRQVVRSDRLRMKLFNIPASVEALAQVPVLPPDFVEGDTWLEYVFP